jgi:glycosyltransferase involved in cell wall biosynthesis
MDDGTLPHDAGDPGRVMVLSHTHPSVSKGGAEIASYTLFEGLRAIGVDALFVAACVERDRARLRLNSGAERIILAEPLMYDDFYHISAPSVLAQLRRLVAAERPTLLNFHHFMNFGLNTLRALGSGGTRLVVTLHEFLAICYHHGQMVTHPARHLCEAASANACSTCFPTRSPEQFGMRQRFALDALDKAIGFVSPSNFLAGRFAAWGLPRDRIAVIENGLRGIHAPSAVPSDALSTGADARDRRWVFGFFGQINPFKGVDVILKAAALVERSPDLADKVLIRIHGNLIGQTPEFVAQFRQAVAEYGCLEYAGPYENTAVGRLMSDCDYVLMPSTWWENSPVVIQEAYVVGRPLLCTGIGGMAEKVKDGVSGLHFRLGDPADLLRAIRTGAGAEMHAKLRAGVPRVTDSRQMAEEYVKAYGAFLRGAQEAPQAVPRVA